MLLFPVVLQLLIRFVREICFDLIPLSIRRFIDKYHYPFFVYDSSIYVFFLNKTIRNYVCSEIIFIIKLNNFFRIFLKY